jgi:ribosomal protein S6--L-glutamate ligase
VVDTPREPTQGYDPAVEETARRAAACCGLVCYGADFVVGPDGPVLVDLNAFPGYRGVEAGPAWVADAVLDQLARRPR